MAEEFLPVLLVASGRFFLLAGLAALALLWIAARRRLRWWPAWFLRFGLAALLLWAMQSPQTARTPGELPPRQILVVEFSEQFSAETRARMLAQVSDWLGQGGDANTPTNRLAILAAAEPVLLSAPDAPLPAVDVRQADLASALSLAEAFLGGQPGELWLAAATLGADPEAARAALARLPETVAVHWLRVPGASAAGDTFVGPLSAPPVWWAGGQLTAVLPIYASPGTPLEVTFSVNGQAQPPLSLVAEGSETLVTLDFTPAAENAGTLTLAASVASPNDPQPGNNAAFAAVQIYQAARVLLATTSLPAARPWVSLLEAQGFQVTPISPADLPRGVSGLSRYQVLVLHNFVATELDLSQMRAIDSFVKGGGGLLFLGGRSAYTLGGYKNTLLEPLLPVLLESPLRSERAPFTLALVLDRSNSMSGEPGEQAPIDLAKEAALRVMETLQPGDTLGILMYSNRDAVEWKVPLAPVGDTLALIAAQEAIAQVAPFGGTYMYSALLNAVNTLSALPPSASELPEVRHILLLSDGLSTDGEAVAFTSLAQTARQAGLSISTFALGEDADEELMQSLAALGGGRYYPVRNPIDLPNIMVAESQGARGANFQPGETVLQTGPGQESHPLLNFPMAGELPPLQGYNALRRRPASAGVEDVLVSASYGDPLFSVWQVGLGRAAAWMSDIGEAWGEDWASGPAAEQFWPLALRYTLPDPALSPVQAAFTLQGAAIDMRLTIQDRAGAPLNNLAAAYIYTGADGKPQQVALAQTAPGVYTANFPAPPPGVYRGVVQYSDPAGSLTQVETPLTLPYPAEWSPLQTAASQAALESWAASAGQIPVDWESWPSTDAQVETASASAALLAERVSFLLPLALLALWVAEIAVRRRYLPWQ